MSLYGWRRSNPDRRDMLFTYQPRVDVAALPPSVDLRSQCPPIRDQGQEGSCTAFATTGADWFVRRKLALPDFEPSEAFTYWGARVYEGTTSVDSGAQVREALRDLIWHGACPSDQMPYVEGEFATAPTQEARGAAAAHKVTSYHAVIQRLDDMKACLAEGYPFVFGFTVYESFEGPDVERTGIVPMPGWFEGVVGGHAVCAVGYRDDVSRFIVRNSWGVSWGQAGYCEMPYQYLTEPNLSADFWTIRRST